MEAFEAGAFLAIIPLPLFVNGEKDDQQPGEGGNRTDDMMMMMTQDEAKAPLQSRQRAREVATAERGFGGARPRQNNKISHQADVQVL